LHSAACCFAPMLIPQLRTPCLADSMAWESHTITKSGHPTTARNEPPQMQPCMQMPSEFLTPNKDGINHVAVIIHQQAPPCHAVHCNLVKALAKGSIDQVTALLKANRDDAWMPLLDHNADPPICAAVHMRCDVAIINLLLEYGADVAILNARRMTALAVLASLPKRQESTVWSHPNSNGLLLAWDFYQKDSIVDKNRERETWMVNVGKLLLMAGCNPQEKTPQGQTAEELATANGWLDLAKLIRDWEEYKAHQLLCSLLRVKHCSTGAFAKLPTCMLPHVFEFVCCSNYWCDKTCTNRPSKARGHD